MDELRHFLATNPQIRHVIPESSDFAALREQFVIQETRTPSIIVCPSTIEEISSLVKVLTASKLPFTVRAGGHDMFGRTQVEDAVTIDVRGINHVEVNKSSHTARVGGGVITMNLLRELQKHEVTTPHPVTPSVGYTGWATHGGYGLLSSHYGLGVDQIVGARVVDAQGNIRDADENMLTTIRGGGGSVALIYELTIKVYPSKKILAGFIIYGSEDLTSTARLYHENYRKLKKESIPPALGLYQTVIHVPEGKSFATVLIWSSDDLVEGQKWVDKIVSLAPVAANTVVETTILEFNEGTAELIEKTTYASIFCPGVYELTPEVVDVISSYIENKPNHPGFTFGVHELRSEAPRECEKSIFNARDPHFFIEIIPMSTSKEIFDELSVWAQRFNNALAKTDPANIYPISYVPLTPNEGLDFKVIYGNRYETLKRAKEQYDPDNVFKYALVQL
ncbi:hypothetical protein VI817_008103 [Penicillium citrinum]|uniref:FAD-binding PCMH-type domain-containing protein n=1 Tax=Penicillium hetheringtonii TaxID=911720 RepID=A0AAD6DCI3_9EURO|nr:hypothetical protein N7450_010294 [Penicillium hetheringtonii]KAK5790816.1 hypothetical protein VI817_008103 [Penicillium citrinum]